MPRFHGLRRKGGTRPEWRKGGKQDQNDENAENKTRMPKFPFIAHKKTKRFDTHIHIDLVLNSENFTLILRNVEARGHHAGGNHTHGLACVLVMARAQARNVSSSLPLSATDTPHRAHTFPVVTSAIQAPLMYFESLC